MATSKILTVVSSLHRPDVKAQLETRSKAPSGRGQKKKTQGSHQPARQAFKQKPASITAKQQEMLRELLVKSRDRFVRVAYGILQNKEDAEDAVQDAFLSAHLFFGNFEGRSAVTTWLTRVVINAALMVRRKRPNSVFRSFCELGVTDTVLVDTMQAMQPSPESAYSQLESFEYVDTLLQGMNPLLREAVTMAYFDELSIDEASSALGIPCGAYKARLFRGRRHLQKKASKRLSKLVAISSGARFPSKFQPSDVA